MEIYEKKHYENLDKKKFVFVPMKEHIFDTAFETEPISYFGDVLIRFRKNKASVVAFVIICVITILAILGPGMNGFSYRDQNPDSANAPPKIEALSGIYFFSGAAPLQNRRVDMLEDKEIYPEGTILQISNVREIKGVKICDLVVDYYKFSGSEKVFWFGADDLGRDLWTRLWRGTRVSLIIGVVSVLFNVVFGTIVGAISGYYGGKVDMIIMRISEIISAIPQIVIVTIFIMYFGTGLFSIIMALVIKGWVVICRMIRAQFYRFKGQEYVLAARTLGVKDMSLIFRHILPNAIGPIITQAMIAIPSAIFAESFLAFIGLGLQAPEPSLGVLLAQGQRVLLTQPYQVFIPALLISILMVSFNLFANGLRDAFDPTLRSS